MHFFEDFLCKMPHEHVKFKKSQTICEKKLKTTATKLKDGLSCTQRPEKGYRIL